MIRVGQIMNLNNIWTVERIEWSIRDLIFPWIAPNTLKFLDSSTDLSWLSRIHGWRTNLVLSTFIYCIYLPRQVHHSAHIFTFIWPFFMTPSNPQPLCSPDVFRLSTPWSYTSTESYSGVTLPSVPPIHNKWLLHGLYIIQISNINFIGMIRVLFHLKIILGQVIRQTIVFIIL